MIRGEPQPKLFLESTIKNTVASCAGLLPVFPLTKRAASLDVTVERSESHSAQTGASLWSQLEVAENPQRGISSCHVRCREPLSLGSPTESQAGKQPSSEIRSTSSPRRRGLGAAEFASEASESDSTGRRQMPEARAEGAGRGSCRGTGLAVLPARCWTGIGM